MVVDRGGVVDEPEVVVPPTSSCSLFTASRSKALRINLTFFRLWSVSAVKALWSDSSVVWHSGPTIVRDVVAVFKHGNSHSGYLVLCNIAERTIAACIQIF
jgi:hypothetical protein